MNGLKDELFATPIDEWRRVQFTENHHRWLLRWYRFGDDGEFFFSFLSPRKRRYCFHVAECGRVTGAEIVVANCEMVVASYCESFDKLDKLEAVLRLTPKHVIDRLFMLLDAVKERFDELCEIHNLLMKHVKHAPDVALLDFIKRQDEYIVLYRDDGDVCTPYIIHHLNDSGLYYARYYGKGWIAWMDFDEMKRYYGEMK